MMLLKLHNDHFVTLTAATDGSQKMTISIPYISEVQQYEVEETIRPNIDYTICMQPFISNSQSELSFGKVCKSYIAEGRLASLFSSLFNLLLLANGPAELRINWI